MTRRLFVILIGCLLSGSVIGAQDSGVIYVNPSVARASLAGASTDYTTLRTEALIDPDLSEEDANWTAYGDCAFVSGDAVCTMAASDESGLYQSANPDVPLIDGAPYRLSITLANVTAGDLALWFYTDGNQVSIPLANGTQTFDFVMNGVSYPVYFYAESGGTGAFTITDVSLKEATRGGDYTARQITAANVFTDNLNVSGLFVAPSLPVGTAFRLEALSSTSMVMTHAASGDYVAQFTRDSPTNLRINLGGVNDDGALIVRSDRLQVGTSAVPRFVEGYEQSDPGNAASNAYFFYAADDGMGKTCLYAHFNTGSPVEIACQP